MRSGSRRDFWSDNDQDTVYLAVWLRTSHWWLNDGFWHSSKSILRCCFALIEGVIESEWEEMSSSTLIPNTNASAVRGRPTPKRCWALSERIGARTQRKSNRHSMIPNGRMNRLSTKQNGKELLHFRTFCGKSSDFSDCCVNLYSFLVYNRVVWHVPQVQCSRLCIISKIFCNRPDHGFRRHFDE